MACLALVDLRLQDDVEQQRQVGHARPLPPRQLSLHGLLLHGAHSLTQALLIPACQQRCSPALHSEPVELPEVQLWSLTAAEIHHAVRVLAHQGCMWDRLCALSASSIHACHAWLNEVMVSVQSKRLLTFSQTWTHALWSCSSPVWACCPQCRGHLCSVERHSCCLVF